MTIVGLTTYGCNQAGNYTLPADYVSALRRAGAVPVLLPPGEARVTSVLDRLDAVVFAGGGDIDPSVYGGNHDPTIYMVDRDRDEMEIALARLAVQRDIPTLAICRGAQIMNVALGGTLHTHIPHVVGEHVRHRLPPREPTPHPVTVEPDSRLARILGQTLTTPMSWHHQSIAKMATGLRAVAWAADGIIEAVEMPQHRWLLAVQWHPELTASTDSSQQRLFDALVAESSC